MMILDWHQMGIPTTETCIQTLQVPNISDVYLRKRFFEKYDDEMVFYNDLISVLRRKNAMRDLVEIMPLIDAYIESIYTDSYLLFE